ncbi:MAG: hypothetical protein ACE5H7_14910 [Acidiferrobacterales bacterium]
MGEEYAQSAVDRGSEVPQSGHFKTDSGDSEVLVGSPDISITKNGMSSDISQNIIERDMVGEIIYGFLLVLGWAFFLYSIAELGLFARILQVPHSPAGSYAVLTKGAVSLIVGLTIVSVSNVYLFQRKCWPILVVAWVICIAFLFLAFALVYLLVFVLRI